MKANNLKMIVTLVMIVLMGFGTDALAQRGNGNRNGNGYGNGNGYANGNGYGNGNGYSFRDCNNMPNLTDAQRTSIEKLQVVQQKEMLQYSNKLRELNAKLNTQRSSNNESMTAINKTVDEITSVKNKQMKQRETHKQEIRKLLTDDQKVLFDSRQNRRNGNGNRNGNRGGKRGGRGNGNGYGNGNGRY